MNLDELLGRVYFWPGLVLAVYGVLTSFLPLPFPKMPAFFAPTMTGLAIMLIGSNILRQARSESKVRLSSQSEVLEASTNNNLTIEKGQQ